MSSSKGDSYSDLPPPATGIPVNPSDPQPWSSGLCDCFSDPKSCCLTFWCPCITFARIADIADKGTSSSSSSSTSGVRTALYTLISLVTGCDQCLYSYSYRSKLRQQYSLDETPCGDFLVHCFCESCALCQEYRELQTRGFNMSIGWHGNMNARNHGEVTMRSMPPTMEGAGMSRDK